MYRYKPNGKKPRDPSTWLSGPDEYAHDQYYCFMQQRNQARWRKEGWDDSFDFFTWKKIWDDSGEYANKGRKPENYCMIRIDRSHPWSPNNVEVVQRSFHLKNKRK
jgi:hypothetical protein